MVGATQSDGFCPVRWVEEAGGRPALTRNCERFRGRRRLRIVSQDHRRVPPGNRCPFPSGMTMGSPRGEGLAEVLMVRWRPLGLALCFAVSTLGLAAPAQAADPHRALVVVDTGTTTYRQVITFTDDAVSGVHALELAGAAPVVYSYSGQGGAVCRLFGVGRDAGPGCLGGADGDNRYWAYFRAPSGTSSFTYSRAGAGSVQVHDGDVEGWKFGTGQAPEWSAVPAPSTTTTVAPAPPPTAPPASGAGPAPAVSGSRPTSAGSGPAGVGSGPVPAPIVAGALDPNAAGSSTTTVPSSASAKPKTSVKGKEVSKRSTGRVASGPLSSSSGGDDGGGASSLALFAIVAAALGAGVVSLRRLRRARGA